MTITSHDRSSRRTLRLWPGVAVVVVQWLLWLGLPRLSTDLLAGYVGAFAALGGALLILVWWLFASRAPWRERLGAAALLIAAPALTAQLIDESIASGGMGVLFLVYLAPGLSLAFVLWAAASRSLTARARWATLVAAVVVACGAWTLVRTEGVDATGSDFAWRWSRTAEERLLAEAGAPPSSVVPASAVRAAAAEWPGFRGPRRDGAVPGVAIATDWARTPPVELWRRPVGPAWSSFAVAGERLYTQEQRGEEEVVTCYHAATGEPLWQHRDPARFWESNAGAGPRATPTLVDGRLYTFGATGILNALDAASGAVVWTRDVAADTAKEIPYWGFSGSPLVLAEVVAVAAAGQLVGYDAATGEPRWFGPDGGEGHSSPHRLVLDGVEQIVILGGDGATGVAPDDGRVLWEHPWPGFPIVQPARTADGDLLIAVTARGGTRRLAVSHGAGGWRAEERWTSRGLKPYFNDFVVHEGHAYGFDNTILAAIDLADGERRWKGGRYGNGQLVLLPDQDLLLAITESGELALVSATPERFTELARFEAIEGKTWNHPVLVGDLLLVRNAREMVAFRLPLAGG